MSVTFPEGFLASGVFCGIKDDGLDLGVLYSEKPAVCSATFTTNAVKSSHIKLCMERIGRGPVRAIVVNSGNANTCTGERGIEDARFICRETSELLGVHEEEVLMASTGIIGVPLPVERIASGLKSACTLLSRDGWIPFSKAIMTTDTREKNYSVEVETRFGTFRIGGSAKGSGMIAPNMATMLCFLTTDLGLKKERLDLALKRAVSRSFNRIVVDGDTSPNDTVFILSNGASAVPFNREVYREFVGALTEVCRRLSLMIVEDGEGVTRVAHVVVSGARTRKDAERVAKTISRSLLFKTALFGCDPNWGRVITAAGYSGARVLEDRVSLKICGVTVFSRGVPVDFDEGKLRGKMKKNRVELELDLGLGRFSYDVWTTDISYDYVRINAEYST